MFIESSSFCTSQCWPAKQPTVHSQFKESLDKDLTVRCNFILLQTSLLSQREKLKAGNFWEIALPITLLHKLIY